MIRKRDRKLPDRWRHFMSERDFPFGSPDQDRSTSGVFFSAKAAVPIFYQQVMWVRCRKVILLTIYDVKDRLRFARNSVVTRGKETYLFVYLSIGQSSFAFDNEIIIMSWKRSGKITTLSQAGQWGCISTKHWPLVLWNGSISIMIIIILASITMCCRLSEGREYEKSRAQCLP